MSRRVVDLLDRPTYGLQQVDRILALPTGTARRWIDGYERRGKMYLPVVRVEPTGDEIVTWGEFVETRLLAEYRDAGVPMTHLRPAIDRLRQTFHPRYPLAHSRPFVAGRELVLEIQDDVRLERDLRIVVVRNDQVVLSDAARRFTDSTMFEDDIAVRIRPVAGIEQVVIDPLRQFGEPVVRSVPTDVIAEQVRAGESIDGIAELYDLSRAEVDAAVRFELVCSGKSAAA